MESNAALSKVSIFGHALLTLVDGWKIVFFASPRLTLQAETTSGANVRRGGRGAENVLELELEAALFAPFRLQGLREHVRAACEVLKSR